MTLKVEKSIPVGTKLTVAGTAPDFNRIPILIPIQVKQVLGTKIVAKLNILFKENLRRLNNITFGKKIFYG